MVSAKLKRLRDTVDAWSNGSLTMTTADWLAFRHDLKAITFEVAILELGIDLSVIDAAVEAATADSTVVLFPLDRMRRRDPVDGGGS